jgi:hypothetical protein
MGEPWRNVGHSPQFCVDLDSHVPAMRRRRPEIDRATSNTPPTNKRTSFAWADVVSEK